MKKLVYLSNLRLPTEKAYGIQIVKMCEAFASHFEVKLIYPSRRNPIRNNIFEYYSVKKIFEVKKLFALDFYFPGSLNKAAVTIKSFISGVIIVFRVLFLKVDVIYSRDELILFILSFFRKNIFFEAHRFSLKRKLFYLRFKNKKIKIIAISQAIKNDLVKIGYEPDQILVAHDGVDLSFFDINISKEDARIKLKLPVDSKIIMYTGHLFEWKGANTLLQVARYFQFSVSNFQKKEGIFFVFVGGMEYDVKKFKEKAQGLNNVLILGHKPYNEIPLFLKAADVLVLPNSAKDKISSYTSPLKLFEYMASGRPIVASSLRPIREILNENNAILVDPDSPENLIEGIVKMVDDNVLSEKLARQSFYDVQSYTWANRTLKILDFI